MRWFLLLIFCYQALSHPTSTELSRYRRELIECCPCNGEDTLARSSQLAASRVDDCPCRARGADSEGASSVFFPSAVHPDGTHIRSNNPKEEQKNLLEPEVGLATSMLETLREATEEEYQHALARDAARSAADARSDESKNLVIVVEPRSEDEDLIPKASHVQESRYGHPLSSSLNRMRMVPTESNLLPDMLKLPRLRHPSVPYRNLLDMDTDVGASNVEEVVTDDKGHSSLFKTPLLRSNIQKITSGNVNEDSDSSTTKVSPALGMSKVKPLLEGLRLPLISKLNPALRNKGDVGPALSSNLEIFDDPENIRGSHRFAKQPMLLKNILKLKDVELIPKTDKLLKKPLFELPKMTVPKLRSKVDDKCDDNESGESTVLNKSEIKQLSFETKSSSEDPLKTGREFKDTHDTEACMDETNRSINEDQDILASPSNIRDTIVENPDNGSSALEDQNNSNDQRINDSDLDSTPLVEQPRSSESEDSRADDNCQDLSKSEPIITDDGNIKSSDYLNNDPTENEATASREILSEDQDAFTDSSNVNNVITEPLNTIENHNNMPNDSAQDENISPVTEDSSQMSTNIGNFPQNPPVDLQDLQPIPSLSDTLSSIRDNIKRLDRFIKTNKKPSFNRVKENPQSNININQKDSANDSGLGSNDDDTIIIFDKDGNPEVIETNNANGSESVTLDDLQKLSDNLLDSSKQEQTFTVKPELENQQSGMKSDISNLEEKTDVINDISENNSSPIIKEERNEDVLVEKTCKNNLNDDKVTEKSSPQVKSISQDSEPRDMTVDASEPIMSVLPKVLDPLNLNEKLKSPIFENPIRPSLNLNPLNLHNNPLDDLINLNPTMPTLPSLDDIRNQISNVFNTNERTADVNVDEDCDYDEKEIEKMALEASSNTQTKLPTLKRLDNLNADLFQLGPMKSPQPDPLGSNRKLNLNSFRAKVPVPKNFEPKPVKLQSSIRNKDGLQRASAILSSKSPFTKTKLPNKVNLLKSPIINFPSLDEIRDSLHRHPSTLLGNPIQHDLNLFKARSFEDLNHNAERTIKGIQKRLRTTLKSPKIAQPALANPQEFLEDVGDKLKAIHYDFNDRLASVHDNFLESTKLALPSPLLGADDKKFSKPLTPSFRTTKAKPMRLQTLASTNSAQKVYSPIEKSGRKTLLGFPQSKTASQKMVPKLSSQDVAASDPVPIKTKPNSQIHTSTKDTKHFPVQRLSEREPLFQTKPSVPKPIFRKPNLKENKVTITFDPTTPKPILRSSNSLSESRPPKNNGFENSNDFKSRGLSRNSKADTGIESFTEVNPWKTQQSVSASNRLKTDNQKYILKSRNNLNIPNARINNIDKRKQLVAENDFLSKVNDAVKQRLANLNSLKKSDVGKAASKPILKASNDKDSITATDMLKSASDNVNAVAVRDALKENVSYKCKLICTKE